MASAPRQGGRSMRDRPAPPQCPRSSLVRAESHFLQSPHCQRHLRGAAWRHVRRPAHAGAPDESRGAGHLAGGGVGAARRRSGAAAAAVGVAGHLPARVPRRRLSAAPVATHGLRGAARDRGRLRTCTGVARPPRRHGAGPAGHAGRAGGDAIPAARDGADGDRAQRAVVSAAARRRAPRRVVRDHALRRVPGVRRAHVALRQDRRGDARCTDPGQRRPAGDPRAASPRARATRNACAWRASCTTSPATS